MLSHCRIGKIRPKGSNVVVYQAPILEAFPKKLLEHAQIIAKSFPAPEHMAGFVIVAWGDDSAHTHGCRYKSSGPLGVTSLPAFVAEILRRDIAEDIARDVIAGRDP